MYFVCSRVVRERTLWWSEMDFRGEKKEWTRSEYEAHNKGLTCATDLGTFFFVRWCWSSRDNAGVSQLIFNIKDFHVISAPSSSPNSENHLCSSPDLKISLACTWFSVSFHFIHEAEATSVSDIRTANFSFIKIFLHGKLSLAEHLCDRERNVQGIFSSF